MSVALKVVKVFAAMPPTRRLNVTMCLCSVLSCPLPPEPPPHVEGSVRLRREASCGPAQGTPDQGGPCGGGRGPPNRQRGGRHPPPGENHTGHRGAGHGYHNLSETFTCSTHPISRFGVPHPTQWEQRLRGIIVILTFSTAEGRGGRGGRKGDVDRTWQPGCCGKVEDRILSPCRQSVHLEVSSILYFNLYYRT